jgi:hypothetical protein
VNFGDGKELRNPVSIRERQSRLQFDDAIVMEPTPNGRSGKVIVQIAGFVKKPEEIMQK